MRLSRVLLEQIEKITGSQANIADLVSGRYADICQDICVTCATDGNHGRSVAWGADRFGCRCVIYIHAGVSEMRKTAIESYNAMVVRTDSHYDDSVRQAAIDAETHHRLVVSDTSYPGYMEIPRLVMEGYSLLIDEAHQQLAGKRPDHVFLQGGCGGFAAATSARMIQLLGHNHPRFIMVEPDKAACLYESILAGKEIVVEGDLDTVMAGLACGEVSSLALQVLQTAIDDVMMISDNAAIECMKLLAQGVDGDPSLVAGESAVAGLAGLICSMNDPQIASHLGLNSNSQVVLIGTEGATDPELYQRLIG